MQRCFQKQAGYVVAIACAIAVGGSCALAQTPPESSPAPAATAAPETSPMPAQGPMPAPNWLDKFNRKPGPDVDALPPLPPLPPLKPAAKIKPPKTKQRQTAHPPG